MRHMLWNASWAHAGEPCRSLVHTYRALNDDDDQGNNTTSSSSTPSFGVMDRHYLKVRTHTHTHTRTHNGSLFPQKGADTIMMMMHRAENRNACTGGSSLTGLSRSTTGRARRQTTCSRCRGTVYRR